MRKFFWGWLIFMGILCFVDFISVMSEWKNPILKTADVRDASANCSSYITHRREFKSYLSVIVDGRRIDSEAPYWGAWPLKFCFFGEPKIVSFTGVPSRGDVVPILLVEDTLYYARPHYLWSLFSSIVFFGVAWVLKKITK